MNNILAAAALLLMLAACGTSPAPPAAPPMPDDPIVCTADVKQCPDGSTVSRNPARGCAFEPCPGAGPQ